MFWALYYRRPLLWRNVLVPALFAFFLYALILWTAGVAHAENVPPTGIGDLMPSPGSGVPAGQGTMYETYRNPGVWQLDTNYGMSDVLDPMLNGLAEIFMALITAIGSACVVIVQWLFKLTSFPAFEDAMTKSIGGAAIGLTETLLPSALAVGALVAFVQHKKGSGLSQLTWVFLSGVVSVSLLTSPGTWVNGVDTVRTVGANVTLNATAAGLGDGTGDFPFKLDHNVAMTGNARDDMLRKAGDSVWRTYVATPWCVAEFGSIKVCQKYGTKVLSMGADMGKRKDWLDSNGSDDNIGHDSRQWWEGHNTAGRLGVTIPSLVAVLIFAVLVLLLCFASLASLLGALMLLLTGVIFACLWVIPGRPRQWGIAWFDKLLGYTLESLIATLTLGAVLCLQTAVTQMFGTYGWLPCTGLAISGAVVGVKFRGTVAQIFGVSGGSSGMLGGLITSQLLGKVAGKVFRGGGKKGKTKPHDYKPPVIEDKPTGGGSGPGGAGQIPKQRPPAPPPLPAGHYPGPPLPPGRQPSPALPPGGKPGGGSGQTAYHRPGHSPAPATRPGPGRNPGPVPAGTRPTSTQAPTVTLERLDTEPKGNGTTTPKISAAGTGAARPRPALPPTTATRTTESQVRPSPTLRPELGTPNYAFRQAPPPLAPGQPKIIQATVIRSTPNGPPPRPATPAAPPRTAAAPPRSATPPAQPRPTTAPPRPDVPAPRTTDKG